MIDFGTDLFGEPVSPALEAAIRATQRKIAASIQPRRRYVVRLKQPNDQSPILWRADNPRHCPPNGRR